MQGRIVFLLEEPSMRVLLDDWLPRLFPGWVDGQQFYAYRMKARATWIGALRESWLPGAFGDHFVVLRDNDGADCVAVKRSLQALCAQGGRPETMVRLVCQELEGWYLGDLAALAAAFDEPKVDTPAHRKRFKDPDAWQKPSVEVKRLVPTFQKMGAHAPWPAICPRKTMDPTA